MPEKAGLKTEEASPSLLAVVDATLRELPEDPEEHSGVSVYYTDKSGQIQPYSTYHDFYDRNLDIQSSQVG